MLWNSVRVSRHARRVGLSSVAGCNTCAMLHNGCMSYGVDTSTSFEKRALVTIPLLKSISMRSPMSRRIIFEMRCARHQQLSRRALSVPSVAGQSAGPGGPGNQNGALRSSVASVRGKTDRDRPPRILGPHVILDRGRFREQTPTLPGLFQLSTCALRCGRTAARCRGNPATIEFFFVQMAAALSRSLPDTYRGMIQEFANDRFAIFSPSTAAVPNRTSRRLTRRKSCE